MAPDGGWSRIKGVPGAAGTNRDVSLVAITATDDRLIAVGPSPKGVVGVWISTDARTWTLADSPGLAGPEGEFEPADVAATSQGLVVVGDFPNHDSSFTWSASVWTDPAPGQPAGPTPVTAAHPCPAAAVTLVDVAEMTPEERLAMLRETRPHAARVPGRFRRRRHDGLSPDARMACGRHVLLPAAAAAGRQTAGHRLPPGRVRSCPVPASRRSRIWPAIAVTGHFDDPRATTLPRRGRPRGEIRSRPVARGS